jgi:hypothetical protein
MVRHAGPSIFFIDSTGKERYVMREFALLLRRDFFNRELQPSLDQLQSSIRRWQEWYAWIVLEQRLAEPFQSWDHTGRILTNDHLVVDGPYKAGGESFCGLIIINANTYEEAIDIARRCPILLLGGTVEIRMEI